MDRRVVSVDVGGLSTRMLERFMDYCRVHSRTSIDELVRVWNEKATRPEDCVFTHEVGQ
jgi:hypothetical protein